MCIYHLPFIKQDLPFGLKKIPFINFPDKAVLHDLILVDYYKLHKLKPKNHGTIRKERC